MVSIKFDNFVRAKQLFCVFCCYLDSVIDLEIYFRIRDDREEFAISRDDYMK